jgi:hypothetical protein
MNPLCNSKEEVPLQDIQVILPRYTECVLWLQEEAQSSQGPDIADAEVQCDIITVDHRALPVDEVKPKPEENKESDEIHKE